MTLLIRSKPTLPIFSIWTLGDYSAVGDYILGLVFLIESANSVCFQNISSIVSDPFLYYIVGVIRDKTSPKQEVADKEGCIHPDAFNGEYLAVDPIHKLYDEQYGRKWQACYFHRMVVPEVISLKTFASSSSQTLIESSSLISAAPANQFRTLESKRIRQNISLESLRNSESA